MHPNTPTQPPPSLPILHHPTPRKPLKHLNPTDTLSSLLVAFALSTRLTHHEPTDYYSIGSNGSITSITSKASQTNISPHHKTETHQLRQTLNALSLDVLFRLETHHDPPITIRLAAMAASPQSPPKPLRPTYHLTTKQKRTNVTMHSLLVFTTDSRPITRPLILDLAAMAPSPHPSNPISHLTTKQETHPCNSLLTFSSESRTH
jgi:hypothetical protein